MKKNSFYITTTAPYVNADPHIGFALEIIQADVIARFKRQTGYDVSFGFGTDEHGVKIYRKALEAQKDPLAYCNEFAQKFNDLIKKLNLSITHFIRTTDPKHTKAAQEFWNLCFKKGDIYKKNYHIRYCVGCELEKTDSELMNGKCPVHPNLEIENYEEENYFFKFSKYEKPLLDFYNIHKDFVLPESKFLEIKQFVKNGLQDFSVSRLKNKMPWGIDVPNDSEQVMYVWFDALVFYISTIGWPDNVEEFQNKWPVIQVAGKDNLRQQSAIWQAMLMSAELPNSKQIIIHGFITSDGQKMSKSLGNVVNPIDLIQKYGIDAVRYYLLREIPPLSDGDFSYSRMEEIYNSDLANELGNLVSRITTIAEKDNMIIENDDQKKWSNDEIKLFDGFQFNIILENIWKDIKTLNKNTDDFAPWKKNSTERKDFLIEIIQKIQYIAFQLKPFLPETSEKIIKFTNGKIIKSPILFPKGSFAN
ncbi:MAG: methionine--tRNA ligase [bacterium]|nr:methionine--tRNA ligase [bacterium]